jgi:hypothetical protein
MQDHGRAWSLWTGGLYIQVNYIGKTQGGRREQVVASTGCRYIQVVAKAGLTVLVQNKLTGCQVETLFIHFQIFVEQGAE